MAQIVILVVTFSFLIGIRIDSIPNKLSEEEREEWEESNPRFGNGLIYKLFASFSFGNLFAVILVGGIFLLTFLSVFGAIGSIPEIFFGNH